MITKPQNGKIKAPRTRGDEKAVQSRTNTDRSTRVRQVGREAIGKSITADRDDWTRGNFVEQRGQAIIGGILDRLISKTLELIEESENRTVELKNQLEELKELSDQFKAKESE